MKSIMSQIEEVVEVVPGWSPIDQLFALYNLALSVDRSFDGDLLEIGSWCGRSTVVLGMAAKANGNRGVKSVDLFPAKSDWYENEDGSYSFMVNTSKYGTKKGYTEQTVWKEPFERDIAPLYEQNDSILDIFWSSVRRFGLEDIVTATQGDSDAIESIENLKVCLAFIDGDHSYDAVCKDISNVWPVLNDRAWVCFDDAFTTYEGVDRAINENIVGSGKYDILQQVTRKMFVARKLG